MVGLALRSLRRRWGAFTASFLALFLGAAILMTFASMLDTAVAGDATGAAQETLVLMGTVVGSWGLVLVIFAVTSTLTLSIRQRASELALLRSVGATPAQVRRMIVGEAAGLAVAAWALAVLPGFLGGRLLLSMLHDTGQVPEGIGFAFGPIALGMGAGITLVSASGAALITVRRSVKAGVAESLADASTGPVRMSKKRIAAGIAFLLLGVDLAVVTSTALRNEGTEAMGAAAQADIFVSLGLAVLAPWLIRLAAAVLDGPLRLLGAAGELARHSLRRRTAQMAAVITPIIVFTGIGVGTLYLQQIENDALAAAGVASTAETENVETLNLVVIGMILVFTALMLVNTLIAATAYRGREFGQQRLAGATPGQVLGGVAVEGAVLTAVGVGAGTFAAAFTVMPYGLVRADTAFPDLGPGVLAGVIAISAALTMATALGATRRALRVPAVASVAA